MGCGGIPAVSVGGGVASGLPAGQRVGRDTGVAGQAGVWGVQPLALKTILDPVLGGRIQFPSAR